MKSFDLRYRIVLECDHLSVMDGPFIARGYMETWTNQLPTSAFIFPPPFLCLFSLPSETPKTQVGSLSFQNRLVGLSLSRRTSLSSVSSESSDAGKAQGPG